jgi:hypothetical protein
MGEWGVGELGSWGRKINYLAPITSKAIANHSWI